MNATRRSSALFALVTTSALCLSTPAQARDLTRDELSVMNCSRTGQGVMATYISILAGADDESIKSRAYSEKSPSDISAALASMRADVAREKPKNEWDLLRMGGMEFHRCLTHRGMEITEQKAVTCFRYRKVRSALISEPSVRTEEEINSIAKLDPAFLSLAEASMRRAKTLKDEDWLFDIEDTLACLEAKEARLR